MRLSGPRLLNVRDVVLEAPLGESGLRRGRQLHFGGETFHVMALFGEHADRLCEYVERSA
jgi:hypothetical protein